MKLRPKFESVRASLANRDIVPSLEVCFGELLHEEQRLNTQNIMEQTRVASNTVSVAYAAYNKGRGKGRNMSTIQCYSCKKYDHIAPNCPEKFFNYCKQLGHIIKECPTRPPGSNKAYHAAVTSGALQPVNSPTAIAIPTPTVPLQSPAPLTKEIMEEMTVHAFSALGLQGSDVRAVDSEGA